MKYSDMYAQKRKDGTWSVIRVLGCKQFESPWRYKNKELAEEWIEDHEYMVRR